MTFDELQKQIEEYVYTEDRNMNKIALATMIANRRRLSSPIWLLIIGASSSGKSQLLRPLSLSDPKFIYRMDDLTENALLSGRNPNPDNSLLHKIGKLGMLVISDLTVLFSKSSETRNTILAQFRMVFDGEMVKYSGSGSGKNKSDDDDGYKVDYSVWKGFVGILAGSTPTVYRHFEEVAEMGERFIYYRMKDYDEHKALKIAMNRKLNEAKKIDAQIAGYYREYIKGIFEKLNKMEVPDISSQHKERIADIAIFAESLRTPVFYDKYEKDVTRIPVTAFPMRVALQLLSLARALSIMNWNESGNFELNEEDLGALEWCAYSLANEERRACLRTLALYKYGVHLSSQQIGDEIGLSTSVTSRNLQHLAAIGMVNRTAEKSKLEWRLSSVENWLLIRRLEGIEQEFDQPEDDELIDYNEELAQAGENF